MHASCLCFYTNNVLNDIMELNQKFEYVNNQREFKMAAMVDLSRAGPVCEVCVNWFGFEEDEMMWEPPPAILKDAPVYFEKQLR
ncbi:unnamed protein product, partial [Choristocarpus tenellus]